MSRLALLCAVQFVLVLDVTIVGVALPSIRRDLGFSAAGLQWVVSAYVLAFGGLLLLGGRLADVAGRRRMLAAGIALFTAGSLGCGLAPSAAALVGARAVQGAGAALATPAALALVTTTFAAGRERTRALGIWTAAAPVGGATGLLLGGALTQALGWPAIFLVTVPVGVVALALMPRLVPPDAVVAGEQGPGTAGSEGSAGEGRQRPAGSPDAAAVGGGRQRRTDPGGAVASDVGRHGRRQRQATGGSTALADVAVAAASRPAPSMHAVALARGRALAALVDAPGAALGTAAVAALVFALSRAEAAGPADAVTLGAAAVAIAAALGFMRWERRAAHPLLPPGTLRRHPALATGVLVSLALTAATSPPFFLVTLHLQHAHGWSPTAAGLGTLPIVLAVVAGAAVAPRAVARHGTGVVMAGGLGLIAAGTAMLIGGAFATAILPGELLYGLGLGAGSVAATTAGTAALPAARQGLASGLLNTAAQVGTALGLAVLVGIATATGDVAAAFAADAALSAGAAVWVAARVGSRRWRPRTVRS